MCATRVNALCLKKKEIKRTVKKEREAMISPGMEMGIEMLQ